MAIKTPGPSMEVLFVYPNGKLTRPAYELLIALTNRTGGSSGEIPDEVTFDDILAQESIMGVASRPEPPDAMIFPRPESESVAEMVFASPANTDYAQAARTVTPGASPWTYTATSRQGFHLTGGTVSGLVFQRGPASLPLGSASASVVDKTYVGGTDFTAGTTTALTLPAAFSNPWVYFDGTFQGDDQYSVAGTTITFNSPIPVGVTDVYVKGLATVGAVGSQLVELNAGDQLLVTYSTVPTITIVPR